jgi:glycosyltransferase involved in cell wall biosynthesis
LKNSIALIGNFLSSSVGTRGVIEDLALRLVDAGWQVLTVSDKPGRVARLLDMITTVWRRRHEYAVAQVDVYSGPAFLWAEVVCWTLKLARKPIVLTLHGGGLPEFAQQHPKRMRRLLKSAVFVTTPSGFLLEKMKAYREDLQLVPNPLDLQVYHFKLRVRPQPRLVWLRAFHAIYNPSLAPRAISLLANDFPKVQLNMLGPDKGDGSLLDTKMAAAEAGLNQLITFPGAIPKNEIPVWLKEADIFLNTTNVDNTPVSLMEAMASGLCLVSTNVGGLPYLLEHEQDALLVPPDDPQAMARAVSRILTEPGLGEHLSRRARHKAEQFDWSIVLPQWEALLTRAAERQGPCKTG